MNLNKTTPSLRAASTTLKQFSVSKSSGYRDSVPCSAAELGAVASHRCRIASISIPDSRVDGGGSSGCEVLDAPPFYRRPCRAVDPHLALGAVGSEALVHPEDVLAPPLVPGVRDDGLNAAARGLPSEPSAGSCFSHACRLDHSTLIDRSEGLVRSISRAKICYICIEEKRFVQFPLESARA